MTTAAMQRDALMPRPPGGTGPGFVLALVVHGLLIVALAIGVSWQSSEPVGVEAELWAAVPEVAAPKAVEPEPPPQPVKRETPPPKPEPVQRQDDQRDAQIAIEKAKKEEAKRKKEEEAERERLAELKKKEKEQLALKQKQEQDEKRRKQLEDQRLAELREKNLKRMMGQAGATGDENATGPDARTAGPTANYLGQVIGHIKPHVEFPPALAGNSPVEIEIAIAPDGKILSSRLVKPSGVPEWDQAVLRAVGKTGSVPRDKGGKVWSPLVVVWRPKD